jgi:hypothetical protein
MAGEVSDEEAAWRELIAQYSAPAAADGSAPWPNREDLSGVRQPPPGTSAARGTSAASSTSSTSGTSSAPGTSDAPGTSGVPRAPGRSRAPGTPAVPGLPGAAGRPGAGGQDAAAKPADPGRRDAPGGPDRRGQDRPGGWESPGAADGPVEGPVPPPAEWGDPVPGVVPAPPQFRIVRPTVPQPPEPAGDDEHFVPPVPPPLPRLDPVAKGAWAALFGGPAYLLIAVMLGWVVPGWAGFCAVAAFVGGFATLVVRLGDRPPRDSGPDDGAVV